PTAVIAMPPDEKLPAEIRDLYPVPPLHGGFVGADADHGPVGAGGGVGEGRLAAEGGLEEVVDEVRVAAAVAGPLEEAQVGGVVDGPGELADRLGQPAGEVRDRHPPGDLRLGQAPHVQD